MFRRRGEDVGGGWVRLRAADDSGRTALVCVHIANWLDEQPRLTWIDLHFARTIGACLQCPDQGIRIEGGET